jgi:hypothetical protein
VVTGWGVVRGVMVVVRGGGGSLLLRTGGLPFKAFVVSEVSQH